MKILEYIEINPQAPLHEIAKVTKGAASMVAIYIDELEGKGYLVKDIKSYNIINYKITREGIKRKDKLLREFYNEVLSIYNQEKGNIKTYKNKIE